MRYDLEAALPHRKPFLLLDEILEVGPATVRAEYTLRSDDELWSRVFAGHYPGQPITPGVLLCEMMFQASAVMVHEMAKAEPIAGIPMVTRIQNVKFKSPVLPGDRVEIRAQLAEKVANAFFMKGSVHRNGKTVVQAEFAVALASGGETV